jgi:hypothetical protein
MEREFEWFFHLHANSSSEEANKNINKVLDFAKNTCQILQLLAKAAQLDNMIQCLPE